MALDALIFDIDGTLLDTNPAHVEAWRRAFASRGYKVPPDRIAVEIGKGGDFLVSDVLGRQAEEQDGDALRQASKEEFLRIARHEKFKAFPGAEALLRRLHERGLRTALATSSKEEHLQAMMRSAGLDLTALVDEVATASDTQASKPAPDLVLAALKKLNLAPTQCALVGDTPYDAQASRHAGVVCLGVLSGGNPPEVLRRGGARAVWRDTADLLGHLDEALVIASPGPGHLSWEVLHRLVREALAAGREGLSRGEVPDGCVMARGDGTVLARGQEAVQQTGNPLAHAPLAAIAAAAASSALGGPDLVLACTVEPCVMCLGAALEAGVETVVFGLQGPADRGPGLVTPPASGPRRMPRVVGGVLADEARALFGEMNRY